MGRAPSVPPAPKPRLRVILTVTHRSLANTLKRCRSNGAISVAATARCQQLLPAQQAAGTIMRWQQQLRRPPPKQRRELRFGHAAAGPSETGPAAGLAQRPEAALPATAQGGQQPLVWRYLHWSAASRSRPARPRRQEGNSGPSTAQPRQAGCKILCCCRGVGCDALPQGRRQIPHPPLGAQHQQTDAALIAHRHTGPVASAARSHSIARPPPPTFLHDAARR